MQIDVVPEMENEPRDPRLTRRYLFKHFSCFSTEVHDISWIRGARSSRRWPSADPARDGGC
jgi:hypothetical protein